LFAVIYYIFHFFGSDDLDIHFELKAARAIEAA
jgi:hypothetical protein